MMKSKSASRTSRHSAVVRSPACAEALISNPAENARPDPATTMTCTLSSADRSAMARFVSSIKTGSKALSAFGRLKVSQPMPSAISRSIVVKLIFPVSHLECRKRRRTEGPAPAGSGELELLPLFLVLCVVLGDLGIVEDARVLDVGGVRNIELRLVGRCLGGRRRKHGTIRADRKQSRLRLFRKRVVDDLHRELRVR